MIPPEDPATGHLPCGRYQTDFVEVHERFVAAPQFATSTTRRTVWDGLTGYLAHWDTVSQQLGLPGLLMRVWLGGSFVSAKLDPGNADMTLVVSGEKRRAAKGLVGAGRLVKLTHRQAMLAQFKVSPLVLQWEPVPHVFRPETLDPVAREYLTMRGAWDDWWQRVRPPTGNSTGAPTLGSAAPVRGYLEVTL